MIVVRLRVALFVFFAVLAGVVPAASQEALPGEAGIPLDPDDPTLNEWKLPRDTSGDPKREPGLIHVQYPRFGHAEPDAHREPAEHLVLVGQSVHHASGIVRAKEPKHTDLAGARVHLDLAEPDAYLHFSRHLYGNLDLHRTRGIRRRDKAQLHHRR